MPNYQVAHIKAEGVNLIIVLMGSSHLLNSQAEQDALMQELQKRATAAGLQGNVVSVWDMGGGKMGFRAPQHQHAFFQQMPLDFVKKNINKELYW